MNTPSHYVLHAGIRKFIKNKYKVAISSGFLWGAMAPDLLLYVVGFCYLLYAEFILQQEAVVYFPYMFDYLFFNNPIWVFAYNVLHSLLTLGIFLFIGYVVMKKYNEKVGVFLVWFFLSCGLHAIVDIGVHHDDGPLFFYPLSDYRFHSPVSYWDPQHYGNYFIIFESTLFVTLVLYLYGMFIFRKIYPGKKS